MRQSVDRGVRTLNVPYGVVGRLGITAEQYRARQGAGEKWCSGCREWHLLKEFSFNADAPDHKQVHCRKRYAIYREAQRSKEARYER